MLDIEEEDIGGVTFERPPSASSASLESEESMNGDIPSALEAEELQLALNKVNREYKKSIYSQKFISCCFHRS